MTKKLDNWCKIKKDLSGKDDIYFLKKKFIRWVSVGENLGHEEGGKGKDFLRPVLILKVLNKNSFIGIPLTSQKHEGTFFCDFIFEDMDGNKTEKIALLNQIKIFSNKRLKDIGGRVSFDDFDKIKKKLGELLGII